MQLHGAPSLYDAALAVHLASLVVPPLTVVVMPITTSSLLLLMAGNSEPWEVVIGVFGAAVVIGFMAYVVWVYATARRRLRIEPVAPRPIAGTISERFFTWLGNLTEMHWVAQSEHDVVFKRHTQILLLGATSPWYYPVELGAGLLIALVNSIVLVVNPEVSCISTLLIGGVTQLVLMHCVVLTSW